MSHRRVLLADDEPQVRSLVRAFLVASQFDVVEACDGVAALEVLERAGGSFDLLITDIKMPRMDGIALAQHAARAFPNIPVLFISGYPSEPKYPENAPGPQWAFLGKPFRPHELMRKVNSLIPADAVTSTAANS